MMKDIKENAHLTLTEGDYVILESYKTVVDGLGEFLGSGFEIVLHSLESLDHSAIKVINGKYSGRTEGAPITDLALEMLAQIKNDKTHMRSKIYYNQTYSGIPIRSATIPIIGENNRIIGLLCINFHLEASLYTVLSGIGMMTPPELEMSENLSTDPDEQIVSAVKKVYERVSANSDISASNRNKEVIAQLNQMNIFKLKNAAVRVADCLGISKNTVYLHLRNSSNS